MLLSPPHDEVGVVIASAWDRAGNVRGSLGCTVQRKVRARARAQRIAPRPRGRSAPSNTHSMELSENARPSSPSSRSDTASNTAAGRAPRPPHLQRRRGHGPSPRASAKGVMHPSKEDFENSSGRETRRCIACDSAEEFTRFARFKFRCAVRRLIAPLFEPRCRNNGRRFRGNVRGDGLGAHPRLCPAIRSNPSSHL